MAQYRQLDPHSSTREKWTNHIVDHPIPADATEDYRQQVSILQQLLNKLAFHDAMKPNLQQTYMTPALQKNKVYFMWDFLGRTLGFAYMVPPTLKDMSAQQKEWWGDVLSRSYTAAALMLDRMPGQLDRMTEMSYPGKTGERPSFGPEILELAEQLERVSGGGKQ